MAHVQLAIAGHTLKNAGLEKNKKREMGEKIEKLRRKILEIQEKFSSKADDALKLAQKELEKGDVENRTEERIAETAGILSETKHWADSTSEPSLDPLVMQTNIEIPAGAIVSVNSLQNAIDLTLKDEQPHNWIGTGSFAFDTQTFIVTFKLAAVWGSIQKKFLTLKRNVKQEKRNNKIMKDAFA